ncbi:transposase [Ktedonobacter racemifer]|uniref:transposase n=1 Tax=Ktedonobacter racemifer TaxID=363277 RepID=UPI000A2EFED3|nr:transposase [Ktedonobacter racemifer]
MTLSGGYRLRLAVRRCQNPECLQYHRPYRPEEEGGWALPHGEYGLDVIALVGMLRYRQHHSLTELHQALRDRGISIGERTVLHLLARYEELVSVHLANQDRLHSILSQQEYVILALDGLRPDIGHEVLWVLRDSVSGEILLARPLLSECEADLVVLITEVQKMLPVPIRGVISDGQHSIRNAVASALPEIPHQLCHFHYLREAAKPVYEADRHAKKELKKQVRGVRPIERVVEKRNDDEAAIIRSYCSAVRSSLTDDGHPPLAAPGLTLHERLTLIVASLERGAKKGASRRKLECLHQLLTKGLTTTAALWPDVQAGYAWVHRAAHLLANAEQQAAKEVQENYLSLLDEMRQEVDTSEPLRKMIATFLKVTDSYRPGLFFCYDEPDLPRTNNDLEHLFGSTRYHERRATGRKQASPGLVVRGAVRIVASVASQRYHFKGPELQPCNLTQWRALRHQVENRHEARREQYRFRKAPAEYLVALEEKLSQRTMRS